MKQVTDGKGERSERRILMLTNVGLLILRLVIGLVFMGHGAQKLFGWFGGSGFP